MRIYSIDEPTAGIGITGDSNIITGNYLENNYGGIVFYQGENNLIIGNTVKGTFGLNGAGYALTFWGGALNNTIYHNNFENNASPQVFDSLRFTTTS